MQNKLAEIQGQGYGLAAISYDSTEVLAAFSRQRGITFPLLSDAGSATIQRYGLLNTVVDEALGPNKDDAAVKSDTRKYVSGGGVRPMMAGIAFPGTIVIDRSGRVTARYFEESYVERSTVSSVLVRAGAGKAPMSATKIAAPHLELVTYPSDGEVAPGNRFSLVAEITPGRGIHVYAPGATGYRAITLTLAPGQPIRVLPMRYPASEVYSFKPLNEKVPVFQKPFRLVQEVVLEGTREAQVALRGKDSVTLTGTLQYQACDDKQCFNPASLPLTWRLSLRPLVVERPSVAK
ncbi:MAG: redoxin domain-containing protein [Acidobacteria bacterium]|nr:redoxin domain-containing protein [Acidobacteriota bacterium]